MKNTILVLGGAGYIGSHTVYELIDNGYDVVVADNLETGFRKAVHPKARFYQGDIRNKEFCDHVFSSEKIDAVIHFAANSQVGESMVNPLKYYDNNLGGTRTMLQSMIEHGVKYIVFSSTAATYGEPERVPILETDPTHPTTLLRRHEAGDGADVLLGVRCARDSFCRAALLQRLRRAYVR